MKPTKPEIGAHSPTPWKAVAAVQNNGPDFAIVFTGKWRSPVIATVPSLVDAELIVRAVNAHQELVASIKWLLDAIPCHGTDYDWQDARAGAIAILQKATGNMTRAPDDNPTAGEMK